MFMEHGAVTKPQHRADVFIDPESDPREGGTSLGDERATLIEYLRGQRLTLQLKCEGLDAEQLARRSVEPSTLSLLGLVRHMAEVERKWFRQRFAGQDVPNRYQSDTEPDGDFDGAVADQAVVDEAWAAWRDEVAFAEQFARETDLSFVGRDGAGATDLSAGAPGPHDRGVRPPQRPCRSVAGAHRRARRPVGRAESRNVPRERILRASACKGLAGAECDLVCRPAAAMATVARRLGWGGLRARGV